MLCSNVILLELYQDTAKAKNGVVLLKAGRNAVENIGDRVSLEIKVDGKTFKNEAITPMTDYGKISTAHSFTDSQLHPRREFITIHFTRHLFS